MKKDDCTQNGINYLDILIEKFSNGIFLYEDYIDFLL